MAEIVKTMKLHLHVSEDDIPLFKTVTKQYSLACNYISQYAFNNGLPTNYIILQQALYYTIRSDYGLKAQLAISACRTVTARYKTVAEQLYNNPFKYKDEDGKWCYIERTLEWLKQPIRFSRPQADLVRGRDYRFIEGGKRISITTLGRLVKADYDVPPYFEQYFDGTWSFGTAKLVSLNKEWYLHIPMTKAIEDTFDPACPKHVVGIDRGLRYIANTYDEQGEVKFFSGEEILRKRDAFQAVRSELQSRGTKSAKRRLKKISGRENRWMADVNHQLSKTLVDTYGADTLFVIEDLTGVSFDEDNLSARTKDQRRETRSWAFYQLEMFLTYKAEAAGAQVIKVDPHYTSQRCPKCGRIRKENRNHEAHKYVCDACGFSANDDLVAAMNLYSLGTLYVSGDPNPKFKAPKSTT